MQTAVNSYTTVPIINSDGNSKGKKGGKVNPTKTTQSMKYTRMKKIYPSSVSSVAILSNIPSWPSRMTIHRVQGITLYNNHLLYRCEHYFCEPCALKHYRKSQRCFVCGKQTFGVFNPAKKLIERLKLEEEGKTYKEADSDEELNLEVMQQPSTSSKATEEEAVTEIEHIHYADDGVANNDTDSDDDSD